jgi:hypothetical protein
MQSFQLNNKAVRFFQANETIYLITADVNKALGFRGKNTALDESSMLLSSLYISEYESFILSKGIHAYSLVIEFKYLVRVVIRSSKSALAEIQDLFCQMVVNGFGFNTTEEPQSKAALPQGSTGDRVRNMSTALRNRYQGIEAPQDLINLPGWLTVTEMLINLGEDPAKESGSLIRDLQFRFWVNRQMADIYRGENAQEPPSVSRNKGKGFCYAPSYFKHVQAFRSIWLGLSQGERKRLGGGF